MRWMNLKPILQDESVIETVVAERDEQHLELQNSRVYSAPVRALQSHLQTPPPTLLPPTPGSAPGRSNGQARLQKQRW